MMNTIITSGRIITTGAKWIESFFIVVNYLTQFHPRIQAAAGSVELGEGQNVSITS